MILVCQGYSSYEDSWAAPLYDAYASMVPLLHLHPDPTRPSTDKLRRFLGVSRQQLGSGQSVRVETPGLIPGSRLGVIASVNRWIALYLLLRRLRHEVDSEIVYISQYPHLLPSLRGLPAALLVYEVVDDYEALEPDAEVALRIARAHRRMLKECHVVWATAENLVERIRVQRPDVVRTTNGVSYEEFARGVLQPTPSPLARISQPRIGLVGRLNDRIDWELVAELCRRRPAWSFVFVGPLYSAGRFTELALRGLERQRNFHRLPGVNPCEMPSYIAAFDVCLIPYRPSGANLSVNPLKLYQYLAVGKPIVAIPLPSLEEFQDVVHLCSTTEDFLAAVEVEVETGDDKTARLRRQERARSFDWQEIAERHLRIIREHLDIKRQGSR